MERERIPATRTGSERCGPAGAKALCERECHRSGNVSFHNSHIFCAFTAATASSHPCFVMQLLSGSFSASVRRSHPSQLYGRGFMCALKCPRWSLKWWQPGQRNGMVAS
eukprot:jgi/Astpho2/3511/Aster-06425